jgi:GT2 family glycosyltransferase
MKWYLAKGKLSPQESSKYSTFLMAENKNDFFNEKISISNNGGYFQILNSLEGINKNFYQIYNISRFEGIYRMLIRAIGTWNRLTSLQRSYLNLSLRSIVFNLKSSYEIASKFRGQKYEEWCKTVDNLQEIDIVGIKEHIEKFKYYPKFSVFINHSNDAVDLKRTIASLNGQIYKNYCIKTFHQIQSNDEWIIFINSGDLMSPHALYWLAHEIINNPSYKFIYSDDDSVDQNSNRKYPRFKPDWSPLYFKGFNYIGNSYAIHNSLVGPFEKNKNHVDMKNIILSIESKFIKHIPAILFHNKANPNHPKSDDKLVMKNREDKILNYYPLVTIIIPTRDNKNLLEACINSIKQKTNYLNYEILVVDNRSCNRSTISYLEKINLDESITVLKYPGSFNYSKINNFAVNFARGKYICFLNDDTEVISNEWLTNMLEKFHYEDVGIVGAKLIYPSGLVQHGGVVVGAGGCANHLHQFIDEFDPSYQARATVPHELSAVTAACMLVSKNIFVKLGGFNTIFLKVAFNDVDLCLRSRVLGYRVVFAADAKLYHHESISRSKDTSLSAMVRSFLEVRYMRVVWRKIMKNDPYYNPNFSYFSPNFILSPAPNIKRPWINYSRFNK